METPEIPDAEKPEHLKARIAELEAEIQRRDDAEDSARSRRDAAASFAGDVAIGAVAGRDVKQRAREAWTAWRRFGRSPRTEAFPEDETRELTVSLLARLTRVRLVYVLAAAIPSVFILAQTILLFQQNARFDRQNNLIAFEQTTALRDLLFITPFDSLGQPVTDYQSIPDSLLYNPRRYRWPQPNESTIAQIRSFAGDEPDIVIEALRPLVRDAAPPVAIGALRVLTQLDSAQVGLRIDAMGGHFVQADLFGVDLRRVDLNGANLRGADLSGANLRGANLRMADLSRANLRGRDLTGAALGGANLRGADLREAHLRGVSLSIADLNRANLSGVDLRGANLFGVDLSGANLRGADLREANLIEAVLIEAVLIEAVLIQANLSGADLSGADLIQANLSGADLSGADLSGADLSGADLTGANIFCEQNAPDGFIKAALDQGASINDSLRSSLELYNLQCDDTE